MQQERVGINLIESAPREQAAGAGPPQRTQVCKFAITILKAPNISTAVTPEQTPALRLSTRLGYPVGAPVGTHVVSKAPLTGNNSWYTPASQPRSDLLYLLVI